MNISLNPHDYIGKRQDGDWEVALETRLRALPEEQRADFLSQMLTLQERAGKSTHPWFTLASSLLTTAPAYERLLRTGIAVANASSVKKWLECSVQRIGMRRVLHVLQEEDARNPQRVDLTTYWLPRLARSAKDRAAVDSFLATRAKTPNP